MSDPPSEVDGAAFEGTERFEVLRHLGSGGMGSVYEALDRQSGARLAIKTFQRASALYQLKQEFRSLADIRHPNLAQLFELILDGDQWFFTMELLDGVDFVSFVRSSWPSGAPPDDRATTERDDADTVQDPMGGVVSVTARAAAEGYDSARLSAAFGQLCLGIDALHRAGKVHRDIKPSNVLVTKSGRVVVLDFGLVQDLGVARASKSARIEGTVAYMSPEQAAQRPSVPASDWYAVGVMLYEALTGELPFEGTIVEVLAKKLMATPPAPAELDPRVEPEWSELCLALLARDPERRPQGSEILARLGVEAPRAPAAAPSGAPPPFVGRRAELEILRGCWEQEQRAEAVVAIVGGPSGIGKTALIGHFVEELASGPALARPALLLAGRCHERETLPFKAFDAIVDTLSLHLMSLDAELRRDLLPRDIRYLSGVFPVLWRVEAINDPRYERPSIPEPKELRRRAFACFAELLGRLCRTRSLLLFIDDFQWADDDSYDLFRALIDSPRARQLTFLISSRADASTSEAARAGFDTISAHLASRRSTRFIDLGPLAPADAARLTRTLLRHGAGADTATRVEAVVREAEGSPFFVHEMTRHLLRGAPQEGRSLTLESMMSDRLDGLPDSSRDLLRLIAVAGDPMPQSVLSAAARVPMGSSAWDEAVHGLTAAGLIRRHGLRRTDTAEIYHDRIRRTVQADEDLDRVDLHGRLAEALEAEPRTRPGLLVHHWSMASEPARAGAHIAAAIDEAWALLAFGQAAQMYRLGLDLETEPAARSALYKGLGDALANMGRPRAAARAYLDGLPGATVAARLELQHLAAGKLLQGGYITEGIETLRGVLDLVGIRFLSSPAAVLASVVYQQLRLRIEGLSFRERALREIPPQELLRLDVLRSASTGFSVVDTIRGADFQVRTLRRALRVGEIGRISEALALHGAYSAGLGGKHLAEGRETVARATALAERSGDPRLLAIATGSRGMVEFWSGDWEQTVAHFARGERLLMDRCHGVHWELATARTFHGLGLMRLGELGELGERYDRHVADAQRMGDRFGAAGFGTRHNVVWLARDAPARAEQELHGALSTWPPGSFHLQHFWALFARCERLLYEGQPAEAQRVMSAGIGPLKRSLLMRVQMVRAEVTELRGRICLALAAAEPDGRRRHQRVRRARRFARALMDEGQDFIAAWGAAIEAGAAWLVSSDAGALDEAIERLTGARLHLYAAAARRRRGERVGGEPGRSLQEEADAWMRDKGVVNPRRMTAMLLPVASPPITA